MATYTQSGSGYAGTAQLASQLAVSFFAAYNARQTAAEQSKVDEAIYSARSRVRAAARTAAAGRADLERFRQSLSNQSQRKAAENYAAALRAGIAAGRDSLAATTFEGRISAAQRAGEVQAQASAAGVAGGSTAMIVGTQALARARQEFANVRQAELQDYGASIQSAGASASSIAGLDQRTIFATFDRTIESPPVDRGDGSLWTDLLTAIGSVRPRDLSNAAEFAYDRVRGLFDTNEPMGPPSWAGGDPYGPPAQEPNLTTWSDNDG